MASSRIASFADVDSLPEQPIPEQQTPKQQTPKQQTFGFWQPEGMAPAKKPKTRASKSSLAAKSQPAKSRASLPQRSLNRTQRWANMTVATLRQSPSSHGGASQANLSVKLDRLPTGEAVPPERKTGFEKTDFGKSGAPTRESLLADLRSRAEAISTSPGMDAANTFSTGSPALDAWLPSGGLKRGQICEWVAARDAGGAGTLSMITAASAIADQTGPIIVIDPSETFHAAGAIACGISPDRIVWCRCHNRRDSVWALDQSLRCCTVAAVWAMLPWHLDDRDARRLQLAAEVGRTPGLFVLSSSEASRPSFAPVRFHVDPLVLSESQQAHSLASFSRPPVDVRTVRVRMNEKRQAILAITPDARLHTVRPETRQPETRSTEIRHETVAVSLAARLADPTKTRRVPPRKTG